MNTSKKVEQLLEQKRLLDTEVAAVVEGLKDKSVPLDERWDTFCALARAKLLQKESDGDGLIEEVFDGELNLYDDFHVERYETIDYTCLYDRMTSHYTLAVAKEITDEERDSWREAVLARGRGSFTFDW